MPRAAVAQIHEVGEVLDLEFVAAAQRRLAAHALAVDVGAVAAAQVDDSDLVGRDPEHAVVPADGRQRQPQVAVGGPADQELVLGHRDLARRPGFLAALEESYLPAHGPRPSSRTAG